MYRDNTKVIKIGDRVIGGGNPILIQSMTNTKTEDVEATVNQIKELEAAGCDIIRCAVPTMEAAKALKEIKKQINIPLVADIHFDYRLQLQQYPQWSQSHPLRENGLPLQVLRAPLIPHVQEHQTHAVPSFWLYLSLPNPE